MSKNPVGLNIARIWPPSYRHANPSAPWPWIAIQDTVEQRPLIKKRSSVPEKCDHSRCAGRCWKKYPQSLFPNWTKSQLEKCKIEMAIENYDSKTSCVIYMLDVNENGTFSDAGEMEIIDADADDKLDAEWGHFIADKQEKGNRVRALFVEYMTGPALRMLGAKYYIEPFFFSSSLNWIPSRFQEDKKEGEGDHITITLPFIQSLPDEDVPLVRHYAPFSSITVLSQDFSQMIGTQAPLRLFSNKRVLVLDLLSAHLVRNRHGNTIISFHANINLPTTKAKYFHERIHFAGQSMYWKKMLEKTDDPTFLLLIFVWHAMYAWDEALQHLCGHIYVLETETFANTASIPLTGELHNIRAHLLEYSSLLKVFKKTVEFIQNTPNPALTQAHLDFTTFFMERECKTLLEEIERLDGERQTQELRLKNVIDMAFRTVNIMDSKTVQRMTETAVRDSAVLKQIAYLTMVFLPASFVTGIFRMNVTEINPSTNGTFPHYIETTIALTAATVWIIVAFQSRYMFEANVPFWKRLAWPVYLPLHMYGRANQKIVHPGDAKRGRNDILNYHFGEKGQT